MTVVSLGPEYENLDEPLIEEVQAVLLETAESADPPLMVIDLSYTKFFGSSFIEIVFRVWQRLSSDGGGKFCFSGLTPYCREVIEVTHLDRLWPIYDTLDEAVAALARA